MLSKIKKDERFEDKEKQEYRVVNWPEYNKATLLDKCLE
jgi:hypothetical protein